MQVLQYWRITLNQEQRIQIIEDAMCLAMETIKEDRNSLYECGVNPRTGLIEDVLVQNGLNEYDVTLGQLSNALSLFRSMND